MLFRKIVVILHTLTHVNPPLTQDWNGYIEEALHFGMRRRRFVFGLFEPRKFKRTSQRHCRSRCYGEVYAIPFGVPKANHAFKHAFTGIIIPTAWVSILFCSFVQVFLGPKEADRQMQDTPLFFYVVSAFMNQFAPGYLSDMYYGHIPCIN